MRMIRLSVRLLPALFVVVRGRLDGELPYFPPPALNPGNLAKK
jgi:hypothetical protein